MLVKYESQEKQNFFLSVLDFESTWVLGVFNPDTEAELRELF